MRISSVGPARPTYFDRNPVTVRGGYYNYVGPHVTTTRWTITNTSSQKMFVDSGAISVLRYTVPVTAREAFGAIQSPSTEVIVISLQYSGVVGDISQAMMGGSIFVEPGGSLIGVTYDASTGGTILYALFAHAVQFDA